MSEDTVRMEFIGKNKGAISYRGVSGNVYRGASKTHRFANVLPEDVKTLIKTRVWVVVDRENKPELLPVDDLSEIPTVLERKQEQGPVQGEPETPETAESDSVDISTIAALEAALSGSVSLEALHSALETELDQEKPRKGVVERLQNAIDDYGNSGNVQNCQNDCL